MKRMLASLATVACTLSFATPALASPNYIRNTQPRPELRTQKHAALGAYRSRHNRNYVRALYNGIVQGMMPSLLAVTGRATKTDVMKASRPGTRQIDDWTGENNCTRESNKCGD